MPGCLLPWALPLADVPWDRTVSNPGSEITGLEFIDDVAAHFPEYAALPDLIDIPVFYDYFIDFAYSPEAVTATDRFGTVRTLAYDEATRTYSHDLVSNDSLQEESTALAKDFLEKYTLFTAGDISASALTPFFPKNSTYYSLIVSMDNRWFKNHSTIQFTNPELKEFFAYTDNLVYIHYTFTQEFRMYYNWEYKITPVDIPLWLVKIDGTWYVARMIYDNYVSATE